MDLLTYSLTYLLVCGTFAMMQRVTRVCQRQMIFVQLKTCTNVERPFSTWILWF